MVSVWSALTLFRQDFFDVNAIVAKVRPATPAGGVPWGCFSGHAGNLPGGSERRTARIGLGLIASKRPAPYAPSRRRLHKGWRSTVAPLA